MPGTDPGEMEMTSEENGLKLTYLFLLHFTPTGQA